jgi:hypothetical protein
MTNDLEKTMGLFVVPLVALLDSPLLGSPMHDEGMHVMVLRGSSDGRFWLLNERWMEDETHQSQRNSLVAASLPIVG